jgi:hypothetical protein
MPSDSPITPEQRALLRLKLRELMTKKAMPHAAPQTDLQGRPLDEHGDVDQSEGAES